MIDSMIKEDHCILLQQDLETLALWWCQLNNWEWPSELSNPEPPTYQGVNSRRGQLMSWIMDQIGMRECLRKWNENSMSYEEFNDFYRGYFEGHQPSLDRWKQYLSKQIFLDKNKNKKISI